MKILEKLTDRWRGKNYPFLIYANGLFRFIVVENQHNVLEIRSHTRMLGYLNAYSPFDKCWFNKKNIVEERDDYYKIIGRTSNVIDVGGLKFMTSEVEKIVLEHENVEIAKVKAKTSPITGEHVELTVQPTTNHEVNKAALKKFLSKNLPNHMIPKRIRITAVGVGHRFKIS